MIPRGGFPIKQMVGSCLGRQNLGGEKFYNTLLKLHYKYKRKKWKLITLGLLKIILYYCVQYIFVPIYIWINYNS